MDKPMQGVRVLELTTYVAAPVCGRLLADMGADVIKVERLTGDDWRQTAQSYNRTQFSDDANPVFDIYNSGKRCISLNLKDEAGMEAFHKLLAQADVFITNTRPQALKRLGIYYDDLKERYPGLIYAILLGYGEDGPDADLPAFDVTAFWGRSGFLRDMTEQSEQSVPVMAPYSAGDTVTGSVLLAEVCAALFRRERTGKGDFVRAGLYQNAIFTMGTMEIIAQKPWGSKFPRTAVQAGVQGHYRCADGEWIFATLGYAPANLSKVYRAIGRPELDDDPRTGTIEGRAQNQELVHKILEEGFLAQTSDHWLKVAREMDIPLVRLNHFCDVTEDEQAWANGYLEHVTFRDGQQMTMPRSPLSMDSVGELQTQCAPRLGRHTHEVLCELGYRADEIQQMKQAGAIGTAE